MIEKAEGKQISAMPLLALRGMAVFPEMVLHFDAGRRKSVLAVNEAMKSDRKIFLVAQKDIKDDDPAPDDLYKIGAVATISQILHTPGDGLRILVEGLFRAETITVTQTEPFFLAQVSEVETKNEKPGDYKAEALIRKAKELIQEYSEIGPKLPQEVFASILGAKNAGRLADYIAMNVFVNIEDKQAVLEELGAQKRLKLVLQILQNEINIQKIENDINEKVQDQIDRGQREYYLREQYKTIAYELGDGDNPQDESLEYHEKIDKLGLHKLGLPDLIAGKMHHEADRLGKMPVGSHEATVVRTWLDTCLSLPWGRKTKDKTDIEHARKVLDADHYGLTKIKERILEFVACRQLKPDISGQIICLVGPPGVGKTSIAKSIAKAMGKKFARVSLGGVRDEADIRGHRKTYIGAMPGRIINAVIQAGTKNPLILLDEVDKLLGDFRGDPQSALLEVLDSEQNSAFVDHFIDLPFDLSEVLFITTANAVDDIPAPLLDRMEIIMLSSYTREEKFQIAMQHLIAKQFKKYGLNKRMVKIAPSAVYTLIDSYTLEAGVRGLERQIASLCRKATKKIVEDKVKNVEINAANIEKFLGPKKFKPDELSKKDEVGVATGLAWTSVGGETMPIEVCVLEGNGKLELTGSLGDVMKESAKVAISFVRSRSKALHIQEDFYKKKDIHIHVQEGAIPKDGPSAGITMATALISALTNLPVRHDVAMTGEITLRGKVLPIGGLKEKTMAAYRLGIKTVIVPQDNDSDLSEIDKTVLDHVKFITADTMDTVIENAIVFPKIAKEPALKSESDGHPLNIVEQNSAGFPSAINQ